MQGEQIQSTVSVARKQDCFQVVGFSPKPGCQECKGQGPPRKGALAAQPAEDSGGRGLGGGSRTLNFLLSAVSLPGKRLLWTGA